MRGETSNELTRPSRPNVVAVVIGAAVGATVRWAVVEALPSSADWPWAIMLVNVVGSLLLGIVVGVDWRADSLVRVRLGIGVGFCGALTTFGTFATDAAEMLRDERVAAAVGYVVVSLALGVVAFVIGRSVPRRAVAP